jgi:hypothetical protein
MPNKQKDNFVTMQNPKYSQYVVDISSLYSGTPLIRTLWFPGKIIHINEASGLLYHDIYMYIFPQEKLSGR